WPTVRANGSTSWPQGDKALHRPVYTARSLDSAAGHLDADIYLHDGGRVTEWARRLQPNDQVAIIGPGGGGVPAVNRIHMFADETGYPAVARILEALDPSTTGSASLLSNSSTTKDYEFNGPPSVNVRWYGCDQQEKFHVRAREIANTATDAFFWYAGEKAEAIKMRELANEVGIEKTNRYIAAYWTQ
ncbi:MAG: SIP domain-containing protein, partial [Bacteroidota bacterium]